jgi:hypothetical protein
MYLTTPLTTMIIVSLRMERRPNSPDERRPNSPDERHPNSPDERHPNSSDERRPLLPTRDVHFSRRETSQFSRRNYTCGMTFWINHSYLPEITWVSKWGSRDNILPLIRIEPRTPDTTVLFDPLTRSLPGTSDTTVLFDPVTRAIPGTPDTTALFDPVTRVIPGTADTTVLFYLLTRFLLGTPDTTVVFDPLTRFLLGTPDTTVVFDPLTRFSRKAAFITLPRLFCIRPVSNSSCESDEKIVLFLN